MARIFELDTATRNQFRDALDDMFELRMKSCRLIYPPKYVSCTSCVYDPIGKKSSNRYKTGGPLPFPNGSVCPNCGGTGKKAVSQEENIDLAIDWTPSRFVKTLDLVRLPDGAIQTKGYTRDIPKIKKCIEMIAQTSLEPIIQYRFKLLGEPVDIFNIIQNRYFYCFWERII